MVRLRFVNSFAFIVAVFAVLALVGVDEARAYTCVNTGQPTYTQIDACGGNAAKAGTTVIGAVTTSLAVSQTAGMISSRITQFTRLAEAPGGRAVAAAGAQIVALGSGASAGDKASQFGLWVNGSYSNVSGDKAGAGFQGDLYGGMVGADYKLTDRFIAGVALGYEMLDVDTAFNRGTTESHGYTVAPYAVFKIDDTFSVDFNVGYTRVDYDVDRLDPLDDSKITGDTDSNRWFATLNVAGNWLVNSWSLGANLGTLYAYEDRDAFTESNAVAVSGDKINLGRLNLGGRLGYLVKNIFEPYATATFQYDYKRDSSAYDDRVGLVLGGGFNIFATDNFYANIEGTTTTMRSDLDIYTINATVRFEF